MTKTHTVPEVYNPDVHYAVKCKIVVQLCQALASYRGISNESLRNELISKLNVDFENLGDNPVGLFLLYEYIYNQRPEACSCSIHKDLH